MTYILKIEALHGTEPSSSQKPHTKSHKHVLLSFNLCRFYTFTS